MSILRQWYNSSSPTVKMLMAISVTSILYVTHKRVYAPYMKKRRHQENEAWANMIIEHEESMLQSTDNH